MKKDKSMQLTGIMFTFSANKQTNKNIFSSAYDLVFYIVDYLIFRGLFFYDFFSFYLHTHSLCWKNFHKIILSVSSDFLCTALNVQVVRTHSKLKDSKQKCAGPYRSMLALNLVRSLPPGKQEGEVVFQHQAHERGQPYGPHPHEIRQNNVMADTRT